ncbi:MAG: glycosyltransferase family 4 protein [Tannerellaceae bacterium]|jgi:glycosyltransferase involved in cell wall biosynthesis|nr:glycosyltransferase family 4 protein [Tannerellaceae bacterium]
MKILLLNTSERTGGAAVAASRLLNALRKAGVEANMLTGEKKTIANRFRFLWERLTIFLCNKGSRKNLFQVSIANTGTDISKHPLVRQADVIHLHWINQGFLSLNDIKRLIRSGKPVVWTLHDLWPATAICHYPGCCEKFKQECSACPKPVDNPLWDLARRVFKKKATIPFHQVTFVGCSRWITEQAGTSALLRQAGFYAVPNPIDTKIFKPADKAAVRKSLGLDANRYSVLFAAAKLSDSRKGARYLLESLRILKEKTPALPVEIVLMGNGSDELIRDFPFPVKELGYISDEKRKAECYAAADVFVSPSLEDNLPNTIMEAMACGTPPVGFRTGGIPEMIDHKKNGYVARYEDAADLAEGILWVIENREKENLSQACVEKVSANYSEAVVAGKYMDIYNKV